MMLGVPLGPQQCLLSSSLILVQKSRAPDSKHDDPCTPMKVTRSEELDFLRTCSSERTDLLRTCSSVTSDIVKSINTNSVKKNSFTIRWKCPICEENWNIQQKLLLKSAFVTIWSTITSPFGRLRSMRTSFTTRADQDLDLLESWGGFVSLN